ncbi:transmembrane protein 200A [Betta splendens]|uniref:Transmembrane protein 200A n=1 Tax=Betta splendens TaxID=158456 RepID=A0A6P7NSH1_BETSP|nr:transmembrane protein 200A [Betta splendens]XP_029022842.1 transmembrane protein 200A [Betta splendens]XP_029022849.1 transmembrane protein 200A [Betta splendens]XP_055368610.1 transmembrane protein 200A [Betta splendens]XP_055368611.1 transmembrane protein 200A [Betta splendens]XP_055368612.1 transmembrane protein 200A [Betta splendens]XP_055368613.1 transmembrane protein 200A [Betta splendens]
MMSQKVRGVATNQPSWKPKPCFSLRGRKQKDSVIQGRLRIRSFPGAFLVLGVVVVVAGSALAVAGYWPDRLPRSSILGAAEQDNISESQTLGWTVQANSFLSTVNPIHSKRMKLLGPVIMGVGLFILICANTVLYENRDRETQMLLAQMRSVICSVSAAVPSADLKDIAATNSIAKHYHWVSSLPAAHVNILCLQQLASSEPLLQTRHLKNQEDSEEGLCQQKIFQTEALHHQESELSPSLYSSLTNSCNSSHTDFKSLSGAKYDGTAYIVQGAPFIKLNNCLAFDSSLSSLGMPAVDVLAAQQRRSHSISYRTKPYKSHTCVELKDEVHMPVREGEINVVSTNRQNNLQVFVNIPEQHVNVKEEQICGSWPRLDLGNGRRYLKLENKEDSVERLLDQLEHQRFQWDKSFGSGPFQ